MGLLRLKHDEAPSGHLPALCGEAWAKFITLCSVENNLASTAGPRPGYGPLPTARVRWRRGHLSAPRARVLDVLIDQPEPCTVSALSALTRQHPNTIREHLDGLVDDRLAVRTRAPAQGRGRPAWLYGAEPEVGSEPGAREYAALACALAAQIARTSRQPRADSIEAGRMWGRELVRRSSTTATAASVGAVPAGEDSIPRTAITASAKSARREVVTLLEELGFAPSPDARISVVKLRHCPLLEAAHQYPEVVCGVHLGVVRGALQELGSDPERTERTALQPFSEPGACRLDMLPRRETAS
jgi:predicted ArsR family transcriptional regulator